MGIITSQDVFRLTLFLPRREVNFMWVYAGHMANLQAVDMACFDHIISVFYLRQRYSALGRKSASPSNEKSVEIA